MHDLALPSITLNLAQDNKNSSKEANKFSTHRCRGQRDESEEDENLHDRTNQDRMKLRSKCSNFYTKFFLFAKSELIPSRLISIYLALLCFALRCVGGFSTFCRDVELLMSQFVMSKITETVENSH